ncbi:HTH-type transcriptional regulator XapR [Shewanella sediminis HAW-EB3]|uniref:HTH-type transcriptional regulator XapR n=1 Tax=Shewanella sediminis (strain HAW-EB3) TaxID=425104 RepID=A8FUT2_SHESH|nr:LysR family transcriptional regulator [Shewanella sediminis]ABV36605.1 HTH-type transcriptional regulator XapR [Shewanella sediminis HAW-EB3]
MDINENVLNGRITLKMLRYFYAVSQCMHFGQAAEQLNISKSPLSAQIKELESVLDVILFERTTRHVQLTEVGLLLQQECALLFELFRDSINKVTQAGRELDNTINIGLMSSIFWAGFGAALREFKKSYPEYTFNFIELAPQKQKQALIEHRIDIGLARFADTQNIHPLSAKLLYAEPMCVLVSDEHPLKRKQSLSLDELINEEFVFIDRTNSASTDMIIEVLLESGFYPKVTQEVIEPTTLMAVVATSTMVSIVPQSYRQHQWQNVCFIPLKETISADIYAIYHSGSARESVNAFLTAIPGLLSQQNIS